MCWKHMTHYLIVWRIASLVLHPTDRAIENFISDLDFLRVTECWVREAKVCEASSHNKRFEFKYHHRLLVGIDWCFTMQKINCRMKDSVNTPPTSFVGSFEVTQLRNRCNHNFLYCKVSQPRIGAGATRQHPYPNDSHQLDLLISGLHNICTSQLRQDSQS